ncbi:MAG: hypothetical protein EOO01_01510 [Chitinophagaceae bacterium]|nr:MAG: hypothetical protein EOO01_01510 [Chitinophagaceae bacterium]
MSLPYFESLGWETEVVVVDPAYSDMVTDAALSESVPKHVIVHQVRAFSKKITSKLGLGSIALRSLYFYRQRVDRLLQEKKFDLIYFSTTQFPVCVLGRHWKKRFGVPYVIDIQDPWHTEYYRDKPGSERPPKYWFVYRLNRFLEKMAMQKVDGLIAVSEAYLATLGQRYEQCKTVPQETIPFGAFPEDFGIARRHQTDYPSAVPKTDGIIRIVYVGRGGKDMEAAARHLFRAFQLSLKRDPRYRAFHFYFIGTSYAGAGRGNASFLPVAREFGLSAFVTEMTDRIAFYQTLNTLCNADALFIPGSDDPQYTASKIYPYVLAQKPLLAIFHPASSVVSFLEKCKCGAVVRLGDEEDESVRKIQHFFQRLLDGSFARVVADPKVLDDFSALAMTKKQVGVFDQIVPNHS